MVFTPSNTHIQAANSAQNAQNAANSSGNGSGNMDAPLAPTQVRDAFFRDVHGHSQLGDDSLDNAFPTTRDVEVEDDIQAIEENEATDVPSSVLFVVHSRTMKLAGGFQPISPRDEGKPHAFTQHNVRDEGWAKFLSDLQDAAKHIEAPYTPALSSLPGLFSTLNLDESVQGSPATPSVVRDRVHPTMVISLWNEHYFHPRGLGIVLAKGHRSLSGDTTSPPPDFPEPSAPFDRDMFAPHFHQHPFPHPPMMHPPHVPFMPLLPLPHIMQMHGMDHDTSPPGMQGFAQQLAGHGPTGYRGGRGGRGGPGSRGRGFGNPFGGRGGFAGSMHSSIYNVDGSGGFGMRGRGGGHARGSFPHFGCHPHPSPFDHNDDSAPFEDDNDMSGFDDICFSEVEGTIGPERERSQSVRSFISDTSTTSTMSSSGAKNEEESAQEKAKGSDDKSDQQHSHGYHHRYAHAHTHYRRGEQCAGDERPSHRRRHHHGRCAEARMAHRFASRRGGLDWMGHGFGLRGGIRGHDHGYGFVHQGNHDRPRHFNGSSADDGYYRLIVVDRST